jgi:hypothetical protein
VSIKSMRILLTICVVAASAERGRVIYLLICRYWYLLYVNPEI